MCVKNIFVRVWGILMLCSLTIASAGWKPIVPPSEYYATKPTTCMEDCDIGYQIPLRSEEASSEMETRIASIITSHPVAFPNEEPLSSGTAKLDIMKPPLYIPGEKEKPQQSPLTTTYRGAIKKTPTPAFVHYKRVVPSLMIGNPIYIKQLDVVKSDENIRHGPDNSQSSGSEVKIFVKPSTNYLGGELDSYQLTPTDSHCSIYKVSFRQELYHQYVQYRVKMPDLTEFTICLWLRIHNVGHDHSLFSYSAKSKKNDIHLWVSNIHEPALFNMKILGQTIFRLNYPIKLYKWYHTCQSWNGHTGEWQVWVDGKRIGRGFHNLLVKHGIEGGGIALSGQQHIHFPKSFHDIPHHYKSVVGLEGEITMLQFYKIALTAGKAYTDHRNHHTHFTTTTPEPPDLSSEEPEVTTVHPLLENGQLKTHINILELIKSLKYAKEHYPHLDLHTDHHPHHEFLGHGTLQLHDNHLKFIAIPNHSIFKRNDDSTAQTSQTENRTLDQDSQGSDSHNIAVVKVKSKEETNKSGKEERKSDKGDETHSTRLEPLSPEKRERNNTSKLSSNFTELFPSEPLGESFESNRTSRVLRVRRQNAPAKYVFYPGKIKRVITAEPKTVSYVIRPKQSRPIPKRVIKLVPRDNEKEASKRNIVFGDAYTGLGTIDLAAHDLHATLGGHFPSYGYTLGDLSHLNNDYGDSSDQTAEFDQEGDDNPLHEPKKYMEKPQKELAENEVRKIMEICSGCQPDPFRKVAVISWRSTPKKIYSGALFVKAEPECEHF